ncbi:MAG: FAD-dependent oxidoreductase [Coleofasciculaceae cyanobacterium]
MFDVAIIGAGLAGLACAQQLQQSGYRVVIVEKSRGVGGRMATRRLETTCADHGVRYLESQGKWLPPLIEVLRQRGILQAWTNDLNQLSAQNESESQITRYIAPAGMTAVAKFLAKDLEIWLNRRVEAITITENTWRLIVNSADETEKELRAKAVVMAIPAPQALMLVEPLRETIPQTFLDSLRSVEFDPCITVMAGYQNDQLSLPSWQACDVANNSDLAWIGLDSSKRPNATAPIFVLQSTPSFANLYLETEDLKPVGQQLLSSAAELLVAGLDHPDWFQVHRWRYAFPNHYLPQDYLYSATPLPLICCGDWCGGNLIDGALNSGVVAASKINSQMQQKTLPGAGFLDRL